MFAFLNFPGFPAAAVDTFHAVPAAAQPANKPKNAGK